MIGMTCVGLLAEDELKKPTRNREVLPIRDEQGAECPRGFETQVAAEEGLRRLGVQVIEKMCSSVRVLLFNVEGTVGVKGRTDAYAALYESANTTFGVADDVCDAAELGISRHVVGQMSLELLVVDIGR